MIPIKTVRAFFFKSLFALCLLLACSSPGVPGPEGIDGTSDASGSWQDGNAGFADGGSGYDNDGSSSSGDGTDGGMNERRTNGGYCGDSVFEEAFEECDDGELNGTYGHCTTSCTRPPFPPQSEPIDVQSEWLLSPPPCTTENWFVKYLWYRYRFFGDGTTQFPGFISQGTGPGQGIPASSRQPFVNCTDDWSMENCAQKPGSGKIEWGDATIWLGEWIAVLGTEYAAFDKVGLDTASTVEALYYALNAFNRLDETAEINYGLPPAKDGFFLRDDVPADMINLPDGSPRFPGMICLSSNYGCGGVTVEDGSYVSQDQMLGMIHGLALVAKLVPDGVAYNGMDLRQEAREMIHRMVNHVRSNNWMITDPNGDHPPGEWGGNAIAFSNQIAQIANKICGTDFGVEDYRDFQSKTEGEAVFTGLMAIWGETFNYNRTMAFRVMAVLDRWDADKMAEKAVDDAKETFALIHALHNDIEVSEDLSLWRLESLLSSAPCGGTCRDTPGCEEADGWKGEHRFTNPDQRLGNKHNRRADFNGLDYLLLHNLYLVYKKGAYAYKDPEAKSVQCDNYPTLQTFLNTGEFASTEYDPQNPCAATDLNKRYCGRSFAAWLVDAYQGKATIFTGKRRWNCQPGAPCQLEEAGEEGTEGNDLFLGTPGDDSFDGKDGDDCLYGFAGNDSLSGGHGYDEIHGGPGDDTIYGEGDGLFITGEHDVLFGDEGNDYLKGGPGNDELYGGEGDDTLIGDSGDDFMNGGPGNDYMEGNSGNDWMEGGPGDDIMLGDSGDDLMFGGEGNDKLDGESGDDWMFGGPGNNYLRGGAGKDSVAGDEGGQNILCGNGGDDTLWGNWSGQEKCRGGGWFMGGQDTVIGCDDNTATEDECDKSGFDDWTPP